MTIIRNVSAQFAAAVTALTLSLALMGATVSNPASMPTTIASGEFLA